LQLDTFLALVLVLCFFALIQALMGSKNSKESQRKHVVSPSSASASASASSSSYGFVGSSSSSWENNYGYPQSTYPYPQPQQNPYQRHNNHHRATQHDYSRPNRKLDRRYSRIADDYHSLDEVIKIVVLLFLFVFFLGNNVSRIVFCV
jgi:E3 ubiquitin-protein ligase RGLG